MSLSESKKRKELLEAYQSAGFSFRTLGIRGIDNSEALAISPFLSDQEVALMASDMLDGDAYLQQIEGAVRSAVEQRKALPMVRFADGEYWFYSLSLRCNGLYRQAESVKHIRAAIPEHIRALQYVSENGFLCPLVFPQNAFPKKRKLRDVLRGKNRGGSALDLLLLLDRNGVQLNSKNYMPFYVIYAYLASTSFFSLVNGRKVCLINSDVDLKNARDWFSRHNSNPELCHVPVPEKYMATRWPEVKDDVLRQIPDDVDLCLAGAGIGAALICASVAAEKSCPVIDAGHIFNIIHNNEKKRGRPRLFMYWGEQ